MKHVDNFNDFSKNEQQSFDINKDIKCKTMFKDFKEFQQFMIFCHTHYELNDVWHFENGDKGILFEGWHNNETGNQKYSPAKLNEEDQPTYKKRTKLEEVYEVWQKVRANLHYI